MEVERVQRWVMSALLVTVCFIFASGMALLSATSVQAGARPALLSMSMVVGVVGILGVRLVHAKSLVTPWLLLGMLPSMLGWLMPVDRRGAVAHPDMLVAMSALADFIAGLPKAELHVHHVGSASPRIVAELAERHPGVVPADPALLADFFAFRDFAHFIEVYLAVVDLIRTPEDVRLLTYEIAREMAQVQQVRYAELTCTPFTSVAVGVPIEGYTEAIEDARTAAERDFGIVLRWIYDIPGESGLPAAEATLDYALNHAPEGLIGFGLGGPEVGVPRPQFKPHFDAARAAGLHSLPHAGETTGPETVWDAVRDLGAERIGHGTSAASDPELMAHLASSGIPLEVCPSSNIATRAVARLEEHPMATFRDAGVVVTINSDDPPMFGTTLNREYEIAADLLALDAAGVTELARTAVLASYAPDEVRSRLLTELDEVRLPPAE